MEKLKELMKYNFWDIKSFEEIRMIFNNLGGMEVVLVMMMLDEVTDKLIKLYKKS